MAKEINKYQSTTINNNNYYNNKNNINKKNDKINDLASPTSLGSRVGGRALGGLPAKAILPFNLKSLKIDLFDNQQDVMSDIRKFKVSLGLINHQGECENFRAGMSSPLRHYKRGADQHSPHYHTVADLMDLLKGRVDGLRASKFYTTERIGPGRHGKMATRHDMSVIMHQTTRGYHFYIIMETEIVEISVQSGQGVSQAQQRQGCVATRYIVGQDPARRRMGSEFWNRGKE